MVISSLTKVLWTVYAVSQVKKIKVRASRCVAHDHPEPAGVDSFAHRFQLLA